MEGRSSKTKRNTRKRTKRGMIGLMYNNSPSQQRNGPGSRGVHDVCDVERRAFSAPRGLGDMRIFGRKDWGTTEARLVREGKRIGSEGG